MAAPTPSSSPDLRRESLLVPPRLKVVSVLTLVLTLVLLVLAVQVGAEGPGRYALSNALAVGALVSMGVFSGVNLTYSGGTLTPGT
ncbi:MAG: hypothetical protein KGJ23_07615 [Euryarchaeota archaeon]|nr:hypothetical protein [Euryarchaeota archaeon]MDE1836466.1 hypothetical protein [Euryarchaeota archaeon]MDE1880633.1 hypothetical protein [Euryarchaeota archaeon]MDE2044214.1 hypothetical protein [Thermoplasmata archaeon]